jgi:hypothetical protein
MSGREISGDNAWNCHFPFVLRAELTSYGIPKLLSCDFLCLGSVQANILGFWGQSGFPQFRTGSAAPGTNLTPASLKTPRREGRSASEHPAKPHTACPEGRNKEIPLFGSDASCCLLLFKPRTESLILWSGA